MSEPRETQRSVMQRHDLPVFLSDRDGQVHLGDEPDYLATNNIFNSVRERTRALHSLSLWQQENAKELSARIALMALVVPLAMLVTPEQARLPIKTAPVAHTVAPLPVFEFDQRLAFAQGLRERLLSNAIASSLQSSSPSKPENEAGNIPAGEQHVGTLPPIIDPPAPGADVPVPQVATSDEAWRLPFGSQTYVPLDLPRTPSESFRNEAAISDLVASKDTLPNVAENITASAALVSKVKPRRPAKRTRTVAQKRRPRQVNQMTASAAAPPPAARQEPNLPPPPILFFLGAQPPQSQPAP